MDREKVSVVISLFYLCVSNPVAGIGGHLQGVQAATAFSCPLTDRLSSLSVSL